MEYTSKDFRIVYNEINTLFNMSNSHLHNEYEFYYMLDGERYLFYDNKTYFLNSGSAFLIKGNEVHRVFSPTKQAHTRMIIYVEPPFFENEYKNLYSFSLCHFDAKKRAEIEALIDEIAKAISIKDEDTDLHVRSLVLQLLIFVKRNKSQVGKTMPHRRVFDIIEYIHEHFTEKITLNDIEQRFGLSVCYFTRLFKEATGYTIVQYINNLRSRTAMTLLTTTDKSISDIAFDVGFDSISYFIKVFKESCNQTPLVYRKEYKKNNISQM